MYISEPEFLAWKENPVTQVFFKFLEDEKNRRVELWEEGYFTKSSIEEGYLENLSAQVQVSTLKDIIDLNYQAIVGEYDHVENE